MWDKLLQVGIWTLIFAGLSLAFIYGVSRITVPPGTTERVRMCAAAGNELGDCLCWIERKCRYSESPEPSGEGLQ